jgi:hypothetical protein
MVRDTTNLLKDRNVTNGVNQLEPITIVIVEQVPADEFHNASIISCSQERMRWSGFDIIMCRQPSDKVPCLVGYDVVWWLSSPLWRQRLWRLSRLRDGTAKRKLLHVFQYHFALLEDGVPCVLGHKVTVRTNAVVIIYRLEHR